MTTNRYLLETTGTRRRPRSTTTATAGSTSSSSTAPRSRAFPKGRSRRATSTGTSSDGTFEDVTAQAGLRTSGWGQGACAGDYDNDGHEDLFVTLLGAEPAVSQQRRRDVRRRHQARRARRRSRTRWGAGCAFLDYDRDGRLDLFAANYIDLDLAVDAGARVRAVPLQGHCRSRAARPGLPGGKNVLYRNQGDGTFEDVSDRVRHHARQRHLRRSASSTLDFDDDGWVDLYVANDSNPSALYRNNRDGTFTDIGVDRRAAPTARTASRRPGMGVAIGDYDRDGTMDIFKTNFAGDTSTLYANNGNGLCEDRTFASGIGLNTRWLGWGVGFVDLDNDGWLDLFLVNGHVYPEVERLKTEAGYKQRKVVYRNRGNGRFDDVTEQLGPPVTMPKAGRGAAFADFDNDGDVDVVVNNVHDTPGSVPARSRGEPRTGSALKLVGTSVEPQRDRRARASRAPAAYAAAGGARRRQLLLAERSARCTSVSERQRPIDRVEVRWPNGRRRAWTGVEPNRIVTLTEGTGGRCRAKTGGP